MKYRGIKTNLSVLVLAILLLCGCSRVQVPPEELRPAGNPVDGIPADPKPEPPEPELPSKPAQPILEEGLCALLPGGPGEFVIYNHLGSAVGTLPAGETDLTGVYPADTILQGVRLSDGSPVLPGMPTTAEWLADESGFTVYHAAEGLLYRLDASGAVQFSCRIPSGAEEVSLLPLGRDFLLSVWSGSGSKKDPWRALAPCVVLDARGSVKNDLSPWLTAPVRGVLGKEILLVARPGEQSTDAYRPDGVLLGSGFLPLAAEDASPALGGVVCRAVWKDGWVCSVGLQPQWPCAEPEALQMCGDHISGVAYDIDGVSSNGALLICNGEAAVWAVEDDTLAFQWRGINYHFPAAKGAQEQLQRCGDGLAVSYRWKETGEGVFRLFFLETGMVLEYDCPVGAKASALLGEGYALFATMTESETGTQTRFWVVDDSGALRQESTVPLLPCDSGPYLLRRDTEGMSIVNLDGEVLVQDEMNHLVDFVQKMP